MKGADVLRQLPRMVQSVSYLTLVLVCAMVLTVGAVFFVWQRYQFVRLGFEVNKLRSEKARLEESIEPLTLEVRYLSRPARISELARAQGLRPPRLEQVVILEEAEGVTPAHTFR